jgi:DNA-3-methyladenine glycosylase II
LLAHDPVFKTRSVDLARFDWQYYGAGFAPLVRIVVGQQLSMKAAATIWKRFEAALPAVTPDAILTADDETLRSVGLSRQKVQYVRNVAQAARDGSLDPKALERMSDDEVTAAITAIKGLGAWSAQMYLMFALARPDIFPSGDLGIQDGMKWYLNLGERPDAKCVVAEKHRFTPHGTAAALLLWHLKP